MTGRRTFSTSGAPSTNISSRAFGMRRIIGARAPQRPQGALKMIDSRQLSGGSMTSCRSILLAATLLCAATAPSFAQSKAKAQNVPEIPYDSVPNFFKLPPNLYFGEGIGIATNSKGHVFVYTRSGDTRLFEFDQNGAFVREISQGLYGLLFAHAVRVDKDDNVWVVDEGSNMVNKFNPAGRVVMTIGRRPEAVDELTNFTGQGAYTGANKPYSFNRPTDVAWDAQGNIFVSDGYGDSRVVKYEK